VHIRVVDQFAGPSTDSPLVHNGYAAIASALLKLGVELSEVRPKLGTKTQRFPPVPQRQRSMHAKALVIDGRTVFIGSMNMDARSGPRHQPRWASWCAVRNRAAKVTSLLDDISADGKLPVDAR